MIMMPLDLSDFYWAGLLIGLVVFAIGIGLRSLLTKVKLLGTLTAVAGAILALAGVVLLVADAAEKGTKYRDRTIEEQLTADRDMQGLRLPRGTTVETYGSPRRISAITLTQPLEISGVLFEGSLSLAGAKEPDVSIVKTGTLAAAKIIDGVPCKAHEEIEFDDSAPASSGVPNAKVVLGRLAHCTVSETFELSGTRYTANSGIYLEDVGVKLGTLATDQDIDGAPCRAGKEVEFSLVDGKRKLARCTLSTSFAVHGTRYAADSRLQLDSAGNVELGVLAGDEDVEGHSGKKGTIVERSQGYPTRFTPARDETIAGIDYKADGEIRLNLMGNVLSAVLAHDQQFGVIPCQAGAVEFRIPYAESSSRLDACTIRESITLLNVVWPAGSKLTDLSSDSRLTAIVPEGVGSVKIGDVIAISPCKIELSRTPPGFSVEPLPGKPPCAQLSGVRFSQIEITGFDYNRNDGTGTGFGLLQEAATVNGTAFHAGASVPLTGVHSPVRPKM